MRPTFLIRMVHFGGQWLSWITMVQNYNYWAIKQIPLTYVAQQACTTGKWRSPCGPSFGWWAVGIHPEGNLPMFRHSSFNLLCANDTWRAQDERRHRTEDRVRGINHPKPLGRNPSTWTYNTPPLHNQACDQPPKNTKAKQYSLRVCMWPFFRKLQK